MKEQHKIIEHTEEEQSQQTDDARTRDNTLKTHKLHIRQTDSIEQYRTEKSIIHTRKREKESNNVKKVRQHILTSKKKATNKQTMQEIKTDSTVHTSYANYV